MECDYKNCGKVIKDNFKAYCCANVNIIDSRMFFSNMISTILKVIQELNWKNLKFNFSLHVGFYKNLPYEWKQTTKNW